MEIIELPPQEPPKQPTAHCTPGSLYEHFLAFLNANNQNGFMSDAGIISDYTKFAKRPDYEEFSIDAIESIGRDTVVGLMLMVATQDAISYKEVLHYGYLIKEVSGRKIKLASAHHIVARLLGYYNHDALHKEVLSNYNIRDIPKKSRDQFKVFNRRDRSMLYMQFLEQPTNN
jgi:hypothetical protein